MRCQLGHYRSSSRSNDVNTENAIKSMNAGQLIELVNHRVSSQACQARPDRTALQPENQNRQAGPITLEIVRQSRARQRQDRRWTCTLSSSVTACAICGSDLHLMGGFVPEMESGDVLGPRMHGGGRRGGPGKQAAEGRRPGRRSRSAWPAANAACAEWNALTPAASGLTAMGIKNKRKRSAMA